MFLCWHRITLNGLASLQLEKRTVLRAIDNSDEESANNEETAEYPSAHWLVRLSQYVKDNDIGNLEFATETFQQD